MYNHNKAQQSKNRVHISWDILYHCSVWVKSTLILCSFQVEATKHAKWTNSQANVIFSWFDFLYHIQEGFSVRRYILVIGDILFPVILSNPSLTPAIFSTSLTTETLLLSPVFLNAVCECEVWDIPYVASCGTMLNWTTLFTTYGPSITFKWYNL